jgi:hypothetical protein
MFDSAQTGSRRTAAIEWRTRQVQRLTGVSGKLTLDPGVPVAMPESRVAIALTITPRDVTQAEKRSALCFVRLESEARKSS